MASRLPTIYSPTTPPPPSPPSIIEPDADADDHQHHDHYCTGGGTNSDVLSDSGLTSTKNSHSNSWLHPTDDPFLRPRQSNSNLLQPRAMTDTTSISDVSPGGGGDGDGANPNPFNFKTQIISTSPVKSNIGQRRGHRYKHSSISTQHQIFAEPPPRPPPVLPASLPVPTLREAWASMQRDQRARLYWSLCHAAVAVYVFVSASGSLATTALSHLVFFDVGSAAICVAVDVLGNFEVWRRSTVRHPFGLQRAEVLAGFAMSVFLVFGGFDLLSHNLKHSLESPDDHHNHLNHHYHDHQDYDASAAAAAAAAAASYASSSPSMPLSTHYRYISPGTVDVAALLAAATTLVSAYGLRNHARIRRLMRVGYLSSFLPPVLSNPFHTLTLCSAFLLLLLPLLSVAVFAWLDRLICAAIAASMLVLGARLAVAQGLMLLMSSSSSSLMVGRRGGPGAKDGGGGAAKKNVAVAGDDDGGGSGVVTAVVREIEAETAVARVDEARFWQVHYGLCVASLRVCVVRGCDDAALSQLRARVARLVQNRLGEGYGRGGSLRWEVTMQTSVDGS